MTKRNWCFIYECEVAYPSRHTLPVDEKKKHNETNIHCKTDDFLKRTVVRPQDNYSKIRFQTSLVDRETGGRTWASRKLTVVVEHTQQLVFDKSKYI